MECKLYTAGMDLRLIAELIDTLWNVNKIAMVLSS